MIICQQAIKNNVVEGASAAASTIGQFREATCPQTSSLMGVPASLGAAVGRSPKAPTRVVSGRLDSSRRSKTFSPPPGDAVGVGGAPRNGGGKNEAVLGRDGAMSGLSLAMMSDEANANQSCPSVDTYDGENEQEEEGFLILPASTDTEAAFHDPPPLHQDDIHREKLQESPFSMSSDSGSSDDADDLKGLLDGGYVDIASSPALPSLYHRCTEEGSPRLNMFQRKRGELNFEGDVPSSDAAIKDRLSDFRSFGVSV